MPEQMLLLSALTLFWKHNISGSFSQYELLFRLENRKILV